MSVLEHNCLVPRKQGATPSLISHFRSEIDKKLSTSGAPIRFVVSASSAHGYACEVCMVPRDVTDDCETPKSIFEFRKRTRANQTNFNAVMVVPTGVGASIGGHAGDSTPAAKLLASVCDQLILHPNVVNASDINEAPANSLYVEGSVLSRLLMGTVGLSICRGNRVLVIIDGSHDELFVDATINSVNAAKACYGLNCPRIVLLDEPIQMRTEVQASGRASGYIGDLTKLIKYLKENREDYDAVAIVSPLTVEEDSHEAYFRMAGETVNPWGGVEAMLTHTLSSLLNVPTAHAPMMESLKVANMKVGRVDPRIAAEVVSLTFVNSVLKGLQFAPQFTDISERELSNSDISVEDISCLVIPDGCIGLPTLAALEQGLKVIAVKENTNISKNDLSTLPWKPGQFYHAMNYWEAAGIMSCLRQGLDPMASRRPIASVPIQQFSSVDEATTCDVELARL